MSAKQEPMFQLLLKTLQNEPEETKAMFFASPESELLKAYQEGREARQNKLPLSANPYPVLKDQDDDGGKYTKNLCWNEGFLAVYVSE
jgi:hypothetical protein